MYPRRLGARSNGIINIFEDEGFVQRPRRGFNSVGAVRYVSFQTKFVFFIIRLSPQEKRETCFRRHLPHILVQNRPLEVGCGHHGARTIHSRFDTMSAASVSALDGKNAFKIERYRERSRHLHVCVHGTLLRNYHNGGSQNARCFAYRVRWRVEVPRCDVVRRTSKCHGVESESNRRLRQFIRIVENAVLVRWMRRRRREGRRARGRWRRRRR